MSCCYFVVCIICTDCGVVIWLTFVNFSTKPPAEDEDEDDEDEDDEDEEEEEEEDDDDE